MKRFGWFLAVAVFVIGLALTQSRAGILAGTFGCGILIAARFRLWIPFMLAGEAAVIAAHYLAPHTVFVGLWSLLDRLPIWEGSVKLITWWGLGLGSFGDYYAQVRTEQITGGYYAHNDPLQFLIEAGVPGLLTFLALGIAVALTTTRNNLPAAVILLVILLQALVEFQFYVPVISVLAGLTLAYHRFNK